MGFNDLLEKISIKPDPLLLNKERIEPFNSSPITTREKAVKVLKDNSYYIFIYACLTLAIFLVLTFYKEEIYGPNNYFVLFISVFCFIATFALRKLKSRIAAIIALIVFSALFINHLLCFLKDRHILATLISFLLLRASYRSVKASFFYHRKDNTTQTK